MPILGGNRVSTITLYVMTDHFNVFKNILQTTRKNGVKTNSMGNQSEQAYEKNDIENILKGPDFQKSGEFFEEK